MNIGRLYRFRTQSKSLTFMSDTQFLLLQKVLVTFRLSYADGMAEISEAYLLYFGSISTLSLLILLTLTFLILPGFFTCLHCLSKSLQT